MNERFQLFLEIFLPILFIILVTIIIFLIKRIYDKSRSHTISYDRINHELDEEEVEFKNSIEMSNNYKQLISNKINQYDDSDDELNSLDEETQFGAKDM